MKMDKNLLALGKSLPTMSSAFGLDSSPLGALPPDPHYRFVLHAFCCQSSERRDVAFMRSQRLEHSGQLDTEERYHSDSDT